MPERVLDIWNKVRLHCPLATPELARTWVNNGQRKAASRRPWSSLRFNGQMVANQAKTGLVTIVRGSAVVQGVGLTPLFAQSDVGRQFRVGVSSPVNTIMEVDLVADVAIIDFAWGAPAVVAQPCTILDAFMTLPLNFNRFMGVLDPVNNWQLRWYITESELNLWDAKRTATTTPWALVSHDLSPVPGFEGQPRYELWPYTTAEKYYPYLAILEPKVVGDLSELEGPLRWRSDILLMYCLSEAASWPGPSFDQKNIYFNPRVAAVKAKEFEDELWILEQRDDEMFPTQLETVDWLNRPFAPIDSKFMQAHDAYGMGLTAWS